MRRRIYLIGQLRILRNGAVSIVFRIWMSITELGYLCPLKYTERIKRKYCMIGYLGTKSVSHKSRAKA